MVGTALRFVLALIVLAAAAAFFLGYRLGDGPGDDGIVGTTSAPPPVVDRERARETGAAIGEAVATGAERAQQAVSTGSLTAKIKAKMALDDLVRAAAIDVDTTGTTVTLSGTVPSDAARARAVRLARETEGVTAVTDRLVVR
jgi:hypothetical protein